MIYSNIAREKQGLRNHRNSSTHRKVMYHYERKGCKVDYFKTENLKNLINTKYEGVSFNIFNDKYCDYSESKKVLIPTQ